MNSDYIKFNKQFQGTSCTYLIVSTLHTIKLNKRHFVLLFYTLCPSRKSWFRTYKEQLTHSMARRSLTDTHTHVPALCVHTLNICMLFFVYAVTCATDVVKHARNMAAHTLPEPEPLW